MWVFTLDISVPVLVLFTKFDALLVQAIVALEEKNCNTTLEALSAHAIEIFERYKLPSRLANSRYPPKGHVTMEDMDTEEGDCSKLIEETAGMLNDESLEQIFVSTQLVNVGVCIERALKRAFEMYDQDPKQVEKCMREMIQYFPHTRVSL